MWRSCVEFFAAAASQDRGWHVLQRQAHWYGRVRLLGRGLFRAHRTTRGAAAAD